MRQMIFKLGFIELFDRTDRYVFRWLLIRQTNKPKFEAQTTLKKNPHIRAGSKYESTQSKSSAKARSIASASTPAVRKMGSGASWHTKLSSMASMR